MRFDAIKPVARALARLALWGAVAAPTVRGEGWTLPDERHGIRTAPILLLSRPEVRADLAITPEVAAEADRFTADLRARAGTLKGRPNTEVVASRRAVDEAQREWLDAKLSPAQRARLDQIDLQWEGFSALITRPVVAEAIGLGRVQRQDLAQSKAKRDADRGAGLPWAESERPFAEAALAILSDAQRQRWRTMLGAPLPGPAAVAPDPLPASPTR